jgi:hypothetical protein
MICENINSGSILERTITINAYSSNETEEGVQEVKYLQIVGNHNTVLKSTQENQLLSCIMIQ